MVLMSFCVVCLVAVLLVTVHSANFQGVNNLPKICQEEKKGALFWFLALGTTKPTCSTPLYVHPLRKTFTAFVVFKFWTSWHWPLTLPWPFSLPWSTTLQLVLSLDCEPGCDSLDHLHIPLRWRSLISSFHCLHHELKSERKLEKINNSYWDIPDINGTHEIQKLCTYFC